MSLYKKFKKDEENCKGKVAYNEDILISIVGLSISSVEGVKVKYKNNDKRGHANGKQSRNRI